MTAESRTKQIIVLGATGYVGGRLVAQLLEAGYRIHHHATQKRFNHYAKSILHRSIDPQFALVAPLIVPPLAVHK